MEFRPVFCLASRMRLLSDVLKTSICRSSVFQPVTSNYICGEALAVVGY